MAEEVPIWVMALQRQDGTEEIDQKLTPVKLLSPPDRNFVWKLCEKYQVMEDGVMGSACSLLERFMAKKVKDMANYPQEHRERMYTELTNQFPLLASVCISLTTKMLSTDQHLKHKQISEYLRRVHIANTLDQINKAEFNILQSVDYSIPLFTNVQKAMMFAKYIGISGILLEAIPLFVDLAEYFRYVIQLETMKIAFSMGAISRDRYTNLRHLHLVAGSVLAAAQWFTCSRPDLIQRLSILSRCHHVYLTCIANIIKKNIISVALIPKPSRKRKHPVVARSIF